MAITYTMAFVKSFPKNGSNYPRWEEVRLTDEEVALIEKSTKEENIELFLECLNDAKQIMQASKLRAFESNAVSIAISLFEKRASHTIFRKEQKAREKFDAQKESLVP
jgi:hypothetical protein